MQQLKLAACLLGMTAWAASPGMASLIWVENPDLSGTGLGSVSTIVTAQDQGGGADGIESGCVSFDGSSDVLATCTTGFEGMGGDEKTGASQTLTRELSEITGLASIADIGLVFNVNEPGNDNMVDLDDLYFTVYSTGGAEIFSAFLDEDTINLINDGGGSGLAGFLFVLDDPQRAAAMAAETGAGGFNTSWRVGGGFLATNIAGDGESLFVTNYPGDSDVPPVPEPSSMLLIGGGLLGVAFLRRRLTNS